jgi:hypothetical protein
MAVGPIRIEVMWLMGSSDDWSAHVTVSARAGKECCRLTSLAASAEFASLGG